MQNPITNILASLHETPCHPSECLNAFIQKWNFNKLPAAWRIACTLQGRTVYIITARANIRLTALTPQRKKSQLFHIAPILVRSVPG